jgi:hypothetical protein
MDGLLMIDRERHATLVWLQDRADARERLTESIHGWAAETGFELPDAAVRGVG